MLPPFSGDSSTASTSGPGSEDLEEEKGTRIINEFFFFLHRSFILILLNGSREKPFQR